MAAIDKSLYEKMTITSVSGEKTADVKTGVISFNYYEDVFSPMIKFHLRGESCLEKTKLDL